MLAAVPGRQRWKAGTTSRMLVNCHAKTGEGGNDQNVQNIPLDPLLKDHLYIYIYFFFILKQVYIIVHFDHSPTPLRSIFFLSANKVAAGGVYNPKRCIFKTFSRFILMYISPFLCNFLSSFPLFNFFPREAKLRC